MTDDEIRGAAYNLEYGEFWLPEYDVGHIIRMDLARMRYRTLQGADRPALSAQPAPPPPEEVTCPYCGRPTLKSLLMSASFGLACPECYDEASHEPPQRANERP